MGQKCKGRLWTHYQHGHNKITPTQVLSVSVRFLRSILHDLRIGYQHSCVSGLRGAQCTNT